MTLLPLQGVTMQCPGAGPMGLEDSSCERAKSKLRPTVGTHRGSLPSVDTSGDPRRPQLPYVFVFGGLISEY